MYSQRFALSLGVASQLPGQPFVVLALLSFRSSDSLFTISLLNSFVNNFFCFLNCYQMTVSSSPLRPILCNSAVFVLLTSQLVYISTSALDCQHLFSPFLFFCFYIIDIGASHTQSPYIYYHTHPIFYKKYNTRETIGLFSYSIVKN